MKIPVLNLFYMLSYSWNCLDEDGILKVSHSEYKSLKNLLAKVLSNGCNHLIKRGLDRSYILLSDKYNGVKGKININETVNKLLHIQCKTICEYDEFDYNIVNNQIIKATISLLLNDKELESNLQLVPSFTLGLADSWAIEVKSRLDRPIGDSLQYESSAVELTHRWTPRSSRLSLGSSFEFEYARDASDDNRWVLGGIAAYEGTLWSSALNIHIEHEMGEPTEWIYSAAAKRKISDRLAWGLEGAGSFGSSDGAEALAALYWRPSPRLTVNFGLGDGLDGAGNLLVRSGFVINLW
jgi:hypothetical protein